MTREPAPRPDFVGIAAAADRLGVHPRTLMAYERIGLVKPERRSNRRRFSEEDLTWIGCAQDLNRRAGISLHGLAMLRRFVPCWAVRERVEAGDTGPAGPEEMFADVVRAFDGKATEACRGCRCYRSRSSETRETLARFGAVAPGR